MYRDLVEQQTTTTGTGAYTVSGSVSGRRTFADAYADADAGIPYVVTDGASGFECGFGTWNEGSLTLARTVVTASSNAGAAVNWAAGTRKIYVSPHTGSLYPPVRHDFVSADDPTDSTHPPATGFGPGSTVLLNGTRGIYMRSNAGFERMLTAVEPNYSYGTYFNYDYGRLFTGFYDTFIGGYSFTTVAEGRGFSGAQGGFALLSCETTNGTPDYLRWSPSATGGDGRSALVYIDDGDTYSDCLVIAVTGTVVAITDDGASGKTWNVSFDASVAAGSPSVLTVRGSPAYTSRASWGTTTGWDVELENVAAGGVNQHLGVKVTGAAATSIAWSGAFQVNIANIPQP